ncbi:MAG: nucleotidyltransferase domain-containing protein [Nanoarchaeota archaeon]
MDQKKYIKEIGEFVRRVRKDFNISEVVLFGSRARGDANKQSDIDLIIVSEDFEGLDFFERVSKMYNYWSLLVAVDFICYTPKEFNLLKNRISLVSDALSYGKIIYQ